MSITSTDRSRSSPFPSFTFSSTFLCSAALTCRANAFFKSLQSYGDATCDESWRKSAPFSAETSEEKKKNRKNIKKISRASRSRRTQWFCCRYVARIRLFFFYKTAYAKRTFFCNDIRRMRGNDVSFFRREEDDAISRYTRDDNTFWRFWFSLWFANIIRLQGYYVKSLDTCAFT